MTLLRAELARVAHRRITMVTLALSVVVVALMGGVTFFQHRGGAPDLAAATSQADFYTDQCLTSYAENSFGMTDAEIEQTCFNDPQWFVVDENYHITSLLQSYSTVGEEWSVVRAQYLTRTPFTALDGTAGEVAAVGFNGTLTDVAIGLALVVSLLGASYIGADWRSGVIESQLVRVPARGRLAAAKLGAAAIAASVLTVITMSLVVVAMLPAAQWRGGFAGIDGRFWLDVAAVIGRAAVVSALFALVAASITFVARHTAAGVTTVLLAFIGGGVIGTLSWGGARLLGLPQNAAAWVGQGDVARWVNFATPGGGYESWNVSSYGWSTAGMVLAVATLLVVAVGTTTFQRRDVA